MSEGGAVLPAGVEEMPAGPALAAVLDAVDPERLSPYDAVRLVRAQRRLSCREQARFAAAAREAALADPSVPGGRVPTSCRGLGDELRAVLCSSRTKVAQLLDIAEFAHEHPEVDAAWRAGWLDEDRVRILATWTRALSGEHLAALLAIVVPEAGGLTLSGLIVRIGEVAVALDPQWAEKTYRRARAQRRVRARRTEAGTGNLSGLDLPLDDTAYSVRHIHALAARAKALGHPGLIDTVRADVMLALLRPRPVGWTDDDLVAALVTETDTDTDTAGDAAARDADGADPRDPDVPDPDQAPPDDPDDSGGGKGNGSGDGAVVEPQAGPDGDQPTDSSGVRRGPRQARMELRVGLGTLLGLDDKPARLPGYGIAHAALARDLARDHTDAEWRVIVTDDTGLQTAVLVTRHRPAGYATTPSSPATTPAGAATTPTRPDRQRVRVGPRGLLTICVSEGQLDALHPDAHPGWERLITDLRRQLTLWHRARAEDRAARAAELRARAAAHTAAHTAAANPANPDQWSSDGNADPVIGLDGIPGLGLDAAAWARIAARRRTCARRSLARFPNASLRRWVEARDQTCVFPPCGASATSIELDHTRAVSDGGLTLAANLDPLCGHDHDLKHGRWRLDQHRPGHYTWTSLTGHAYSAEPAPPLPDLPEPRRFHTRSSSAPHETATTTSTWSNEPYPSDPARPPPSPTDSDPPPF